MTHEQIATHVWHGDLLDTNTVVVHIKRLRAELERDRAHPELLQTVRGEGYRFVSPAHTSGPRRALG